MRRRVFWLSIPRFIVASVVIVFGLLGLTLSLGQINPATTVSSGQGVSRLTQMILDMLEFVQLGI